MSKPALTMKKIRNTIKQMDAKLEEDSESYRTAVILLATLRCGTSAERIAAFTGYTRAAVRQRARNLRRNGVWTKAGKLSCEWFGKHGGAGFWADTLVADGLLERVPAETK